ncbi:MAG: sulfite reductase subunit A, partial [Planctomycetales bacterium]|nr:sulfite reductase subunit A [Planctomycetales bacterium]
MTSGSPGLDQPLFLPRERLGALISELQSRGYIVVGPVIRQAAIVYDELYTVDDLPRGWTDLQEAGTYRLERRADEQYFGYVVGPHSWKQFLFPPVATVATAVATEAGWNVTAADGRDAPQFAFFGMRACELAAVAVQDRVFIQKDYADPIYKARRDKAFFVAVNCTQAAPTCFCASMNTGPRCTVGFDLALTEIDDGFVVEIGGERGRNVIVALGLAAATNDALRDAEAAR